LLGLRSPLIAMGLPAGLAAGLVGYVLSGQPLPESRLSPLHAAADGPDRLGTARTKGLHAAALSTPLFASGPVAEIPVSLVGLSQSHGRRAALLSIGGKPAEWVSVGETRGEITVEEIASAGVMLDTPAGPRRVSLDQPNTSGSDSSQPAPAQAGKPASG